MDFDKRPVPIFSLFKLESENSISTEDTESVCSFQGRETDLARDTSDTEQQSVASEYELEIEYEVDDLSDCESNSLINTSDESDLEQEVMLAAAAAICNSSFEKWVTDAEDSDNSTQEDISFSGNDFWTCVKCKSKNNLFRYCEKCFQDRKTLFPPRPRPKKPKKNKKPNAPVKLDNLRSCLNQMSQDSGFSSQECPPLELDKIRIPEYLSSSLEDDDIIPNSQAEEVEVEAATSQTSPPSTSSKKVTLNDIVKTNRKRQISESSLSDLEDKRPRWRDVKNSPTRGRKSPESDAHVSSPSRKRKSTSSERDVPSKKSKSETNSQAKSDAVLTSQDTVDMSGKTSDLGSEISSGSGSGILDKVEDSQGSVVESKEMCIFCNSTPKNAIFLHGNIAHMCCCYRCAKKTWRTIKRCPMCNRRVNNVVRVYI